MRERERQRETERDRDRETDRDTEAEAERETDRQTETQRQRDLLPQQGIEPKSELSQDFPSDAIPELQTKGTHAAVYTPATEPGTCVRC